SKHLSFLRQRKVVEVHRHQNWMIYSLPAHPGPELEANLKCLQDCLQTEPVFKSDLKKLRALLPKLAWLSEVAGCCAEPPKRKAAGNAKKPAKRHSSST